jgi:hypothetical protein
MKLFGMRYSPKNSKELWIRDGWVRSWDWDARDSQLVRNTTMPKTQRAKPRATTVLSILAPMVVSGLGWGELESLIGENALLIAAYQSLPRRFGLFTKISKVF